MVRRQEGVQARSASGRTARTKKGRRYRTVERRKPEKRYENPTAEHTQRRFKASIYGRRQARTKAERRTEVVAGSRRQNGENGGRVGKLVCSGIRRSKAETAETRQKRRGGGNCENGRDRWMVCYR